MARHILIIVLISVLTALNSFSQVVRPDERLRQIVSQNGQAEVTIPYTDRQSIDLLTVNVSILSVKNKIVYVSLSPLTVEWFILQKY